MGVIALIVILCCLNISCKKENNQTESENFKAISSLKSITEELNKSDSKNIMVIAHRGDWRNSPENSLQAIKNCIDMGVDMVEIDVRLTKDSIPVLMHDKTIDRTTNGKGKIINWTLDSLKTLYLKNGANHKTHHLIPTLEEALLTAKGEILVNLDKCYNYFDIVYEVIKKTNTQDQVIMKGNVTLEKLKNDFEPFLDEVAFMPVINLDDNDAEAKVNNYISNFKPAAFEFVFNNLNSPIINKFDSIQKQGSRVWVNSLWESLNAGYEDDMAVLNTDSIYGWYVKRKVNMIQTDRPQLLLEYLRRKNLHN